MEAGAVSFDDGSRRVTELARDLGIADHHYVLPFYGHQSRADPEAVTIGNEMVRQAAPKLLRFAREHAI